MRFRVKSFKGNSCEHGHKDYKEEVITQGDNLEDIAALNRKKEKESLEIISAKDNINNLNGNNKENLPSASNLNLACRICLEKNESEDNPLLTPCKCAGTMKFIHLQCLQKWLRGRTVIKQNNVSTTIIYKSLSCELCKSIFPGTYTFKCFKIFKMNIFIFRIFKWRKWKKISNFRNSNAHKQFHCSRNS